MATLRKLLNLEGFNWEKGKIVWQRVNENELEEEEGGHPGWSNPIDAEIIDNTHKILDKEFSQGYGGPECPRFVAIDDEKIYFPWQYNGATGMETIYLDIEKYLDIANETPYPGG